MIAEAEARFEAETRFIAGRPKLGEITLVGKPQTGFNKAMQRPSRTSSAKPQLPATWLLAIAERRDRACFTLLFDHYAPRLKAWLIKSGSPPAQAEEILQDAMLNIWQRAAQFDPAKASPDAWVFAIARNRRIDLLRREKMPTLGLELVAELPAESPQDSDEYGEAMRQKLREALADLPPEQAELIHYSFFSDKPHAAIAAAANIPLGTVKSRIRLALEKLRKALKTDQME